MIRIRDATDSSEFACGNLDKLRVGNFEHAALVPDGRKVPALRALFGMLAFFHFVSGNAHQVIVFQRQLHRFLEGDVVGAGGGLFLGASESHRAPQRHAGHEKPDPPTHDFLLK
jgi:hypothetical protein